MIVHNPDNLREIERDIVSALIFSKDGKLLMGKKDASKGGVYSDCWHIPGGGIDEGEEKELALRREILEETNITLGEDDLIKLIDDEGRGETEKVLKDTGEKVWCNMRFNVYKITLSSDSKDMALQPSDDLVELEWFDVRNLSEVKLTPPSVELFTRLGYI